MTRAYIQGNATRMTQLLSFKLTVRPAISLLSLRFPSALVSDRPSDGKTG